MHDGAERLLESQIVRRADVSLHVLDTGGVLFDGAAQRLYGTNTSATFIWCMLEDGVAPADIAAQVQATFGTPEIEARQLVADSFRQWRELGLIGLDSEPSAAPAMAPGMPRRTRAHTPPPPVLRNVHYQRDYRLLDTRIRLRFSSKRLLSYVEPMLASLADDALDEEFRELLYLIQFPDRIVLCNQERVIDECETWSGIVPMLKASLVLYALDRSDDLACLHAATLIRGKRCLLIPGQSGQGKSTLSAAMVAGGFRLMGDDTTVLCRRTFKARAMPFGICLKKGSWPLLEQRFPSLLEAPIHDRSDGKRIRYLLPEDHSAWVPPCFAAKIGAVVLPRPTRGCHAGRAQSRCRLRLPAPVARVLSAALRPRSPAGRAAGALGGRSAFRRAHLQQPRRRRGATEGDRVMMSTATALRLVTEALKPDAGGPAAAARRARLRDWTGPLAFANENLVSTGCYASLVEAGRLDEIPEDVREYLAFLHQHNGERNAVARNQAADLLLAMAEAGVDTMVLKGIHSLLIGLYADPAARMVRDIDILIRPQALQPALAVLERMGYHILVKYDEDQHAYAEFGRDGDPCAVDLHLEIVDVPHVFSARDVWPRARSLSIEGIPFYAPSPTDALLHHLIHAQIHYRGGHYWAAVELRQLVEFAALVRRFGLDIDWPRAQSVFERQGLGIALESYALIAQRLLDLPWPLERKPSLAASLHAARAIAQLRFPLLKSALVPWSNLRAAFAHHRLSALYPQLESEWGRMARHTLQFLRKTDPRSLVYRFIRER